MSLATKVRVLVTMAGTSVVAVDVTVTTVAAGSEVKVEVTTVAAGSKVDVKVTTTGSMVTLDVAVTMATSSG